MQQPLSQVQPDAQVMIANAGDRPFKKRPNLGVFVAEAINSWSNVESFHLALFVKILGGDASVATSIYLALDGRGPKSAALTAAISKLGDPKVRSVINAVRALAKTAEKDRDKLAHHAWGYSQHPKLQDALLLIDPRNLIKTPIEKSDIYVWREADLKRIIDNNDRLCGYGLKLQHILDQHPANKDGLLLAALCSQPEIQEKLDRQASQDQPAPAGSP